MTCTNAMALKAKKIGANEADFQFEGLGRYSFKVY
jgi:hypothetical protein